MDSFISCLKWAVFVLKIKEKMLEGKALIQDTDMSVKMQIHAMTCASQALDLYDVSECESIAGHVKKVTTSCCL